MAATSKRSRPIDLHQLVSEPPAIGHLAGSGADQAPLLVDLLCAAGMRAVHQSFPPGVAVYLRPACSAALDALQPEHVLLWLACGIAPDQLALEEEYEKSLRVPLLAKRFAARLRRLRPRAELDAALSPLDCVDGGAGLAADRLEACVRRLVPAAAAAMDVSELQVEREWSSLEAAHSTLANACLAHVLAATGVHVQDATLITSADPNRVRLSILLYDSTVHETQQRPRRFQWVPCLAKLVSAQSAEALGREMCEATWAELAAAQAYHPPAGLVGALTPTLIDWFSSCMSRHAGLAVRATLAPQRHICLYLHGGAGCGKSSFVRALLPALVAVVRRYLHPEAMGGFVKQALNKPLDDLALEFERRPNNNDLSVVHQHRVAGEGHNLDASSIKVPAGTPRPY